MQIDKTTYNDLSVFSQEEEFSVFHKINFTRTNGGKEWLRWMMKEPSGDIKKIKDTQTIIRLVITHLDHWPSVITNGTMTMIDRFYDSRIDPIPSSKDFLSTRLYKTFHSSDYGLIRFSVTHFRDFISGLHQIAMIIDSPEAPAKLQSLASRSRSLLQHSQLEEILQKKKGEKFSVKENLYFGFYLVAGF